MLKNTLIIPILMLLFISIAAVGQSNFGLDRYKHLPKTLHSEPMVIISQDSLWFDTLSLSMAKVPQIQSLYTVAKQSIGKWAKIFVVVKIVESGNDGDHSILASRYFNVTGMRQPHVRKTLSIGPNPTHYASFENWHDCMLDFGMYLNGLERGFKRKHNNREPSDQEMIEYMYGIYNTYPVWRKRSLFVLHHFQYT